MMQLSHRWSKELRELPESGMGYQYVNLTLRDGTVLPVVVYNAQAVQVPSSHQHLQNKDIVRVSMRSA